MKGDASSKVEQMFRVARDEYGHDNLIRNAILTQVATLVLRAQPFGYATSRSSHTTAADKAMAVPSTLFSE